MSDAILRDDPLWYKDAVVYQLHVKSFADANGDGIGDFRGLIERLPYVAALGATAVWLLPFYPSPLRDDGYDIGDYRGVQERYGTMRDVRAFIKEAHRLGLRVITELVINHTSDQHAWFQRARRAPRGSSARRWYVWSDDDRKYAGTRIIFTDTETSNWTWDPVAGQYYWHRFFSHQPDLNFDHPPVFAAVADVMRFWFDLGVDGMRLDAVPYLVEREGTSCENLPETHAILKRLRAIVDAEYPDRFLLAEANQWPEDVRQYFGDGDECHMAFHFPLMPRMFMGIAAEDRYPLYDILRQTPSIPENCAWAIFLRNHDELTLEMVTDRERAFMYGVFAVEPRMKINVGIRRRLAPLLENDRRRIELMTSLLLSMPGTPILYYGDEIGMGDNVYLGDRDGVRTSMQWSADRNGGFSRSDPQRLFLPAITDPVYGYAAVNVEAQERTPSSLLHWTRRMIAVRRAHRVFGRGSLTLLYPRNRTVAAYLREDGDESVLCVANLSRSAQAVELDLSRFIGYVPVELVGGSVFPPIHDDRYVLTLQPHAFFWFRLAPAPTVTPPTQTTRLTTPEVATLVLPRGATAFDAPAVREAVANDVVAATLDDARARAFGPPGRDASLIDLVPVAGESRIAIARLASGGYGVVLLGLAFDDGGERYAGLARNALARVRTGPREGILYDGGIDDAPWTALAGALIDGSSLDGASGRLLTRATWSLGDLGLGDLQLVRRTTSTRAAVVGDALRVVLFRRTVTGPHPALQIGQRLHDVHFPYAPPLLGAIAYEGNDGTSMQLGTVHRFILAQGDAAALITAQLRRMIDRRRAPADQSNASSDESAVLQRIAQQIGRRLAAFHLALVDPGDPAFTPHPLGDEAVAATLAIARHTAQRALEALRRAEAILPEPLRSEARELARRGADVEARLTSAARALEGTPATRIHGDVRLERLLVVGEDVLVVPPGSHASAAMTTPLHDVATVLRSYGAVAAAALSGGTTGTVVLERDEHLAEATAAAANATLSAWRDAVAGTVIDPGDRVVADALDGLLVRSAVVALDRALAEGTTALAVPLRTIARVLDRTPIVTA